MDFIYSLPFVLLSFWGTGAQPLFYRKMKNKELKIIQDFYDFMLWMIKHIEKYPRHHRYSLEDSKSQRQLLLL